MPPVAAPPAGPLAWLLFALFAAAAMVPVAHAAPDEIHWTHLSPTAVTFSWRGSADSLRYGLTNGYGTTVFASTPSPLPFSSPGPFREAKLTSLTPATSYRYAIGDGPDHTFTTAPIRGTSGFTIHAVGDIGSTQYAPGVGPLQSVIAADHPAFVVALGDLTYGNVQGQASVDQHFNDVMTWSQEAAYMPAWGNHEWEAGDDLRNYKGRFDLPNPQTSPGSPAVSCCGEDWYWFDYGDTRFIAYPETWTGARAAWNTQAQSIMAQAQADAAISYIVTFGHKPAYSAGPDAGNAQLAGFLDALGSAYSKYVLDLSGHVHNYQRSHPLSGVVHVVSGTGGRTLDASTGNPSWLAFRATHHGSTRLRFAADGIRGWLMCGPSSVLENVSCAPGTVIDSFFIANPNLPPPPGAASLERRVVAGADDAEEATSGSVSLTSSDLELVTDASVQTVGLRFTGLAIPAGATITSAYLQFAVDEVTSGTIALAVRAQAADHAAPFTTAVRNLSTRARTAATVSWAPAAWTVTSTAGPAQRTPDLKDPIAEVVGRSGWASGNALALLITGLGKRTAEAFEGDAARAPLLHIDYVTGPPPPPPANLPPFVDAGPDRIVTLPGEATLAGTVTDDGLPAPPFLSYQWVIASGPTGANLTDPNAATTRVQFTQPGNYIARLTVSDGAASANDSAGIEGRTPSATPLVIERRVASSADDAEESSSGSVSLTSSDLELVTDGSAQTVGLRFTNLGIPTGSTITSAYLQFAVDEVTSGTIALAIRAQAADNAATFGTASRSLSSRARTAASVAWSPAAWPTSGAATAAQRTPGLEAVIAEVVGRSGWGSGNALALVITGTGKRTADAFDGDAARAPLLHVEYLPGTGTSLADGAAAAESRQAEMPAPRLLAFVAPSPLDRVGTLHLELPRAALVRVRLYDVGGRLVRPVIDGSFLAAGRHQIGFDPRDGDGRAMTAGVYFLTIEAGGERSRARVVVLD